MNGLRSRIDSMVRTTIAGMKTRVTTVTCPRPIDVAPNMPLTLSIGSTDMSTIGTMMPMPKTIMHGAFSDELYVFPASLRPVRATFEASRSILSLSSASRALEADTTMCSAMLYDDASSGNLDSS